MTEPAVTDPSVKARQRALAVLAKASPQELAEQMSRLGELPEYELLRPAEPGMVMVRGRAGGNGAAFCLGEMTVTRCSVRLGCGLVGHGYVQGRSLRHAELAALADALGRSESLAARVAREVIEPLAAAQTARAQRRSRQASLSTVDFFTLVRGENAR